MDRAAIYRKTSKGVTEITTTERTVDRRLRPLLILVDGNRTTNSIHALMSGIGIREEDFNQLAANGYIEPIARPHLTLAANDSHVTTEASSTLQLRSPLERFADGQRYLTETVSERLGLRGLILVLKIEKANSAQDLVRLLPQFEAAIARKVDNAYAQHCRRIAETILKD